MLAAACEAAKLIKTFDPSCCGQRQKADHSPVSAADEAGEALIWAKLVQLAPGAPILGEEHCADGAAPKLGRSFFVIDALDGTRDFLAGSGEYSVNVALVADGAPLVGAIVAPALDEAYLGVVGAGAWRGSIASGLRGELGQMTPVTARMARIGQLRALASRSHADPETEALLDQIGVSERLALGSSLKFARVAAGEADVYPRLQSLMQWDVAAGHALVTAAGGVMTQPDGAPLVYGADAPCQRAQPFIAWGDPNAARALRT